MTKREFVVPLAVSVAALVGGSMVSAQASTTDPARVPAATAPEASADQFVLTRCAGGKLRLADHESHASHASHSSHASGS